MYKVRDDEPAYAFVPNSQAPDKNIYGKPIQLIDENDELAGKSLNINGDPSVGRNPNRYKQHGFYFNADNCISCHACESACSEKNNLPPHLAFRSVGYVEGGTYPDYRRLNISMACNHCDNPVCLKGCPTRAYTKFAEYGAVLQDPNICFGCGYCTWVCPYNAPQLDPVEGQVQKCNMCVDRLEVGLKPACASACLAGALDFGVIETTPENRDQLKTSIPGFPTPDISHPNIRFQQTRSLPRQMTRTDSIPLQYVRDEQGQGKFNTQVRENIRNTEWGLSKLRSREDPLVIFTLVSQAVIGAFIILFLAPFFGVTQLQNSSHPAVHSVLLFSMLGLQTFALALSTMHLGKPHRFYRAFNNLRYSPVSREVAGIAVFYNLLGIYTVIATFPQLLAWLPPETGTVILESTGTAAVLAGLAALYFMHSIYRIKARPFWNHWQVLTSFYGNMLALGSIIVGLVFLPAGFVSGQEIHALTQILCGILVLGLLVEATGLWRHARYLHRTGGEAAASHYIQRTRFGKTYLARNLALGFAVGLTVVLGLTNAEGAITLTTWGLISLIVLMSAFVGRALFYVLVIPTTMPGAFFWRNSGFQEHARETGLATMPQVGVVNDCH